VEGEWDGWAVAVRDHSGRIFLSISVRKEDLAAA
jgi:hypothetical protein